MGPDSLVVDLAAGTGKLTRLLLHSGATVVAIEPIEVIHRTDCYVAERVRYAAP
jgi:16S rRNA A1518/A1519 N6-dimethyltransferase RsmA/KsgA/DIM1 with predicted DNA glycosylase/AP lyase activity